MVKLLLAPVSVQGLEAEKSIVDGIRRLEADPRPDIILITRGGGSKEDLWVFNSERIARAAYACKKPVVSAVGHEIDTTILDYVADLRAPTPSAAAELCVPDQAQVRHEIFILQQNIQKNIQSRLEMCYNKFNIISPAAAMQNEKKQELTPVRSFCGKRQHRYRPLQPKRQLPAPRGCTPLLRWQRH